MNFSVVVPVYNVEEYLCSCVESILPAMLPGDEVILSLGNSTDKSTVISHQLAQKNPVIRIVQQSGKGLSDARNCAIQVARGDYIICVDSDDYVDTPLFCQLLDRFREGHIREDVIAHDFYRLDRRTGRATSFFQIGKIPDQTGTEFLPQMLQKRQCFWNVWRYMYRRAFLQEKRIFYRENLLSEDVDYTTSVFLAQPTVRFVHSPFYVYTVGRGDSLMDRPTLKRLSDTVEVLKDSIMRLKASDLSYAPVMAARFQFEYVLNMALTVEIKKQDRSSARELYQDWKRVLSDSQDPLVRLVTLVLHITGLQAVSYGLHAIKLVRRRIYLHRMNRSTVK